MIYAVILFCFFLWSFFLFFISNWWILIFFYAFHLLFLFVKKMNFRKYFQFLMKNLLFILFIFLCNLLFTSVLSSFLVSFKLFLAICYTYMITSLFSPYHFAEGFSYLLSFLKIFRIDVQSVSLSITIAFAFIPIMMDEAKKIKLALQNRGFEFTIKNLIKRPHLYLLTYFNGLFNRVDELEKTLAMKGFQ